MEVKTTKIKKEYNKTVIFFINSLKIRGEVTTWREGADLYKTIVGDEIRPSTLSRQAKDIVGSDIDISEYLKYLSNLGGYIKKEEKQNSLVINDSIVSLEKQQTEQYLSTFSITDKELVTIFGVNLEKDQNREIKRKVMLKLHDEKFLLPFLGYDPGLYELKSIEEGSWTTPVKRKTGMQNEEVVILIPNYKYRVMISKRKNALLYVSKEECEQFLKQFLSKYYLTPSEILNVNHLIKEPQIIETKKNNPDLLMVCPGFELHIGKLATVADFEDYSTLHAIWRFRKAAVEIYEYQKKSGAGTLLLGVGNDFFNADTSDDKTTAGTEQRNDTRYKEVYVYGKVAYIEFIETMKYIFDKVIVKGHPGNHDEKTSFTLLEGLNDRYEITNDGKVEVPFSYEDVRYNTAELIGDYLFVFAHGKAPNGKAQRDLRLAQSVKKWFPEKAKKATHIYVFAGHNHIDSENTFDNVTVIRTASLSGVDLYHSDNNYLAPRQGHSVYLFDKKRGYLGKHNITLTDENKKSKIKGVNRDPEDNIRRAIREKLNLNETAVTQEIIEEQLSSVNKIIGSIRKRYDNAIKGAFEELGIELAGEQLDKIRALFGYDKTVKPFRLDQMYLKEYKKTLGKK